MTALEYGPRNALPGLQHRPVVFWTLVKCWLPSRGCGDRGQVTHHPLRFCGWLWFMYLRSLKYNYCLCFVLILCTTWEMWNLKSFIGFFFYSKRTLDLWCWSNANIFFCFLKHSVSSLWCSECSRLSLCRGVFTRGNCVLVWAASPAQNHDTTILLLLISKPQFFWWFSLSHMGASRNGPILRLPIICRPGELFCQLEEVRGQQRGSEAVSLSSGISGSLSTLCLSTLRNLTVQVHTSGSSNQNIIGNLA